MTNEELAIAIKAGQREFIHELWGQCEKVIHFHASQWAQAWKSSRYDFDYDDFVQSGYFALLAAVEKWEPERGLSFTSFLRLCLKTAFAEVAGCRTTAQMQDMVYNSIRLESPLQGDCGDNNKMIADTIGGQCEALEALEDRDYGEYVAKAVREAVATLPGNYREAVEDHFLSGLTYAAVAEKMGLSVSRVQHLGQAGLRKIREGKSGENLRKLYFGERNLYRGTSYTAWRDTGTSAPEREVMRFEAWEKKKQGLG